MQTITFFGSSKAKPGSIDYQAAESIAADLAMQGFNLATGAYGGIMEAALKGGADSDIRRIGIASADLPDRNVNPFVNELIETKNYYERLSKLTEIADACVFFPGGTGTLLEISYILAFQQRGFLPEKPIFCFGDQWRNLLEFMAYHDESSLELLEKISFGKSPAELSKKIINHFQN